MPLNKLIRPDIYSAIKEILSCIDNNNIHVANFHKLLGDDLTHLTNFTFVIGTPKYTYEQVDEPVLMVNEDGEEYELENEESIEFLFQVEVYRGNFEMELIIQDFDWDGTGSAQYEFEYDEDGKHDEHEKLKQFDGLKERLIELITYRKETYSVSLKYA